MADRITRPMLEGEITRLSALLGLPLRLDSYHPDPSGPNLCVVVTAVGDWRVIEESRTKGYRALYERVHYAIRAIEQMRGWEYTLRQLNDYRRGYEDGARERATLDDPNLAGMRFALRAKFDDRRRGVDRFESPADAAHQIGRFDALDNHKHRLDG